MGALEGILKTSTTAALIHGLGTGISVWHPNIGIFHFEEDHSDMEQ